MRSDAYTTEETTRYLDPDPLYVPEDRASRERSGLILAFVGLGLLTIVCLTVWWQR